MTDRVTTAYLELQRAGLVGGEISFAQKQKLMQILRDLSETTTLAAEADALKALYDTYITRYEAVLAIGTVVDGSRAAMVTAADNLVAASEALQTAINASKMVATKTAVDADNTKIDVLGALTGSDTSASFNAALGDMVATKAAAIAAVSVCPGPLVGLDVPSAALSQSNTDLG